MAKLVDQQIYTPDVYDLAAEIGKDFENLIDLYGTDSIKELMTKVIMTLEYLENTTDGIDTLQKDLHDVKTKVQQLEHEKLERAQTRGKLDQELEVIEENWRKETAQLNSLVIKLQIENKRLGKAVSEKETLTASDCQAFLTDANLVIIQNLKDITEQYRIQVATKDTDLFEKANELNKLQVEVDKLSKSNKELSRKNKHMQKQLCSLVEEKSDLQANVQNQLKECQELQTKLDLAVKENIDLSYAENSKVDLRGKIVFDSDDPNRPRFTLEELKHILHEKNDLKAKISDLEDELSLYKPKPISGSPVKGNEELPVQGPINKEPDDKLHPDKKKLGIRRFFHFLRRSSVEAVPLVQFSASRL